MKNCLVNEQKKATDLLGHGRYALPAAGSSVLKCLRPSLSGINA